MATTETPEVANLRAEVERHRRANLLRAVVHGIADAWIVEAVNAENFDRVPWLITEGLKAENERLRVLMADVFAAETWDDIKAIQRRAGG